MSKILVVDDSSLERKLLVSTVKKAGIKNEIIEAANGEEALNIVGQHYKEIAIILLDWQMPVMNGIEFMQAVTKVPEVASIPIMMITASSSEDSRNTAKEANPNLAAYIVKPYRPEVLIAKLNEYIS